MTGTAHPLRNAAFRAILLTRLFSALTGGFYNVPIMWWVLEQTGSGSMIASVGLVSALAGLIAAPIGGVLADRGHKRLLIQATYVIDALLLVLMATLVLGGHMRVGYVFPLLAVTSFVAALRGPASSVLVPMTIPRAVYQQGNAMMSLTGSLASLSGYALAGAATGFAGVHGAMLIGAGLLAAAILTLATVPEPTLPAASAGTDPEQADPPSEGLLAGLGVIWSNPLLFWTFAVSLLLNFVLIPLEVTLAPFARELGAGAREFGFLSASISVGQLLGMLALSTYRVPRPWLALVGGTFGIAAAIAGLSVAATLPQALTLLALGGLSAAVMNVQLSVVAQLHIPHAVMGRAYGVMNSVSSAVQPLGYAGAAALLAWLPLHSIFLLIGTLLALAAAAWLHPTLRVGFEKPMVSPATD
ncbi:MFS transporter [Deinococcus multiflagellatus]|uniref:Multidrug efflux pump Tap n=1 Tax=Deinococcus multiflagellatus TaxID=1656887 RepID=A0ABW1ZUX1_9DEIO|nr:MFS transporter [Deinococcus multiflagellatus]MBZ9715002.1 MFS transporter [Deinococcus multiflagellatus]